MPPPRFISSEVALRNFPFMNAHYRMGGGGSGKETCSRRRPSILLDSEVQDDEESDALPVLLPAQQHLPEVLPHSCNTSDDAT